jgi:hypothetical protein
MTACSRLRPRGLVRTPGPVRALRAAVALAFVTMHAVAAMPAHAQSGDSSVVATVSGPATRLERPAGRPGCVGAGNLAERGCGSSVATHDATNVVTAQALALAVPADGAAVASPGSDARAPEDQASIASRVGAALAAGLLIMAFTGRRRAR